MKKPPVLLGCALARRPLAQSSKQRARLVYEMAPPGQSPANSGIANSNAPPPASRARRCQLPDGRHRDTSRTLVNTIPNLTWTAAPPPRYLQIRGIGENSQFEGETRTRPSGFLVDDLNFTGIRAPSEASSTRKSRSCAVPQAGAFREPTRLGGLIKFVTKEPEPLLDRTVERQPRDGRPLFGAGLAVGGPLLDRRSERLTFRNWLSKQHFQRRLPGPPFPRRGRQPNEPRRADVPASRLCAGRPRAPLAVETPPLLRRRVQRLRRVLPRHHRVRHLLRPTRVATTGSSPGRSRAGGPARCVRAPSFTTEPPTDSLYSFFRRRLDQS